MHGICALVITSGLFMACRTFIRFGRFTGYVPFGSSETGSNISGKTDDSVICPVCGNRVKRQHIVQSVVQSLYRNNLNVLGERSFYEVSILWS